MRRSEAVKAFLVSKGVEKNRVYTEGKGEKQPVADNKTAEGRAKNRRVEIEVVGTRAVSDRPQPRSAVCCIRQPRFGGVFLVRRALVCHVIAVPSTMTINADPQELAKFSDLAHRWWDPESEFRPLHQINPLRLDWIDGLRRPAPARRVLDVGCGGGILAESMARRGRRRAGHRPGRPSR